MSETRWTHPMLTVAQALATLPGRCWQRHDGLRCEGNPYRVIDLTGWQFWWALRRLEWNGWMERHQEGRYLATYRLTPAGHSALARARTRGEQP